MRLDSSQIRWFNLKYNDNRVVTGCDSKQEWQLEWWYNNFRKHNQHNIYFADYGISRKAREWCQERGEIIDVRFEMTPWLKKPFSILWTRSKKILWMDPDCEVRGDINPIFEYVEKGTALTMDGHHPELSCKIQSGVVGTTHNDPTILDWAQNSILPTARHDQQVLNSILEKHIYFLMPKEYQWLRLDGDNNPKTIIMHWTGKGKDIIREQIKLDELQRRDAVCIQIGLLSIGDTLTGLSTVAGFKKINPNIPVIYSVRNTGLEWAKLSTDADLITTQEITNKYKWNNIYNIYMRWTKKDKYTGQTRHEMWSKQANCTPILPTIKIPQNNIDNLIKIPEFSNGKQTVILTPWASQSERNWSDGKWKLLEDLLIKANYNIIIHGSNKNKTADFKSKCYFGITAADLAAQFTKATLVIGVDSGPIHLAGILKIPALVLCGITIGKFVFGIYPTINVVQAEKECAPCMWNEQYDKCKNKCEAMERITPEQVFEKVQEIISSKSSQ